MLKSSMISGIAGRSIVSEKKTVNSVLLSSARVNHALRLMAIILPELSSVGLSPFGVSSVLSILGILFVSWVALFIVNGNKPTNS
jgi:hypothetical protein